MKQLFNKDFWTKCKIVVGFFILNWVSALMLGFVIIGAIVYFKNIDFHEILNEMNKWNANKSKDYPNIIHYVLELSLIGPIIEEMMFRLALRFNKQNIAIAIGMIGIHFLSKYFITGVASFLAVRAVLSLPLIYFGLAKNKYIDVDALQNRKGLKYLVFTVSVLLFGFAHVIGYPHQIPWYILVLLTANIFVGGFIFSYVRLKYGMKYSIIIHCLSNLTVAFKNIF
jgi:Type II CAAX prenyl endopeptidase Rce1-like